MFFSEGLSRLADRCRLHRDPCGAAHGGAAPFFVTCPQGLENRRLRASGGTCPFAQRSYGPTTRLSTFGCPVPIVVRRTLFAPAFKAADCDAVAQTSQLAPV